jgi:hypothetical protein
MSPQQERAVALTAIAQPPTASPTFGDLASALLWHADNVAASAVVHVAERSMRPARKPGRIARAWHSWPVFTARCQIRETWRGIPGPWPVKLALTALAVAEPGPFGEMALAAFGKWNGARLARKAGAR